MGRIALHPAVERMAVKGADMDLDESAIVQTMRRSIEDSITRAELIKRWLLELNPLSLRGPALVEWADEVSDYILPTHLRRSHATASRKQPESDQAEHQGRNESRQTTEAGSSNSPA